MPIPLEAGAVDHREGAEQTTVFIPLAAPAVQPSVTVTQFLGKLAVAMPDAASAMKIARHDPVFRVDSTVPVIKPFYAQFWHLLEIHLIRRSIHRAIHSARRHHILYGLSTRPFLVVNTTLPHFKMIANCDCAGRLNSPMIKLLTAPAFESNHVHMTKH
jgi:hypothetical protein